MKCEKCGGQRTPKSLGNHSIECIARLVAQLATEREARERLELELMEMRGLSERQVDTINKLQEQLDGRNQNKG